MDERRTGTLPDPWTDRLSEYLDQELSPRERAALERHLPGCPACTETLAALRAVVARAAALPARAPDQDLWPGIAARLAPRPEGSFARAGGWLRRAPRWSFSLPQLAAAGFLLALLTGGGVWLALSKRPVAMPGVASPQAVAPLAGATALPASAGVRSYDAAIAELERSLRDHRHELDPSTVAVIEKNLRIIDQATAEARRALAADPANRYLNDHLVDQLELKVTLLRQATALVASHG